jgi:hypothetical protein
VALGWFTCEECGENYCKECAVDRDRMETEMAENPLLVATPTQDIMKDSWIGRSFKQNMNSKDGVEINPF